MNLNIWLLADDLIHMKEEVVELQVAYKSFSPWGAPTISRDKWLQNVAPPLGTALNCQRMCMYIILSTKHMLSGWYMREKTERIRKVAKLCRIGPYKMYGYSSTFLVFFFYEKLCILLLTAFQQSSPFVPADCGSTPWMKTVDEAMAIFQR